MNNARDSMVWLRLAFLALMLACASGLLERMATTSLTFHTASAGLFGFLMAFLAIMVTAFVVMRRSP